MTEELAKQTEEQLEMPFLAHFAELRSRVFKIVVGVLVFSIACFSVAPMLYEFLAKPIYGALPESSRQSSSLVPSSRFSST